MRRLTSCGSRGAKTKSACPQKIGAIWIRDASRSGFPRSLPGALRYGPGADAAGASMHRRAAWCGDVASLREASEPVLSLADC
jgi:hypothetical protein